MGSTYLSVLTLFSVSYFLLSVSIYFIIICHSVRLYKILSSIFENIGDTFEIRNNDIKDAEGNSYYRKDGENLLMWYSHVERRREDKYC